jgi:hypothetical protein
MLKYVDGLFFFNLQPSTFSIILIYPEEVRAPGGASEVPKPMTMREGVSCRNPNGHGGRAGWLMWLNPIDCHGSYGNGAYGALPVKTPAGLHLSADIL